MLDIRAPGQVNSSIFHLSTAGEKPVDRAIQHYRYRELLRQWKTWRNLELEDMKALGLYIEKCVDEVLRSHLVERPPNTTKNYVPK